MAALTIVLWQYAEAQQRENVESRASAITNGFVQTLESGFAHDAESISRMSQRWGKSVGVTKEAWVFETQNYKRDVPGFRQFFRMNENYDIKWLISDGDMIEPEDPDAPARRTTGSRFFLEELREERRRFGTYFYVNRAGESVILLAAPMFTDDRFAGFVGGGIDSAQYIGSAQEAYADDLRVRLNHDGETIFQSPGSISMESKRYATTQSVQLGETTFTIDSYPTSRVIDDAKSGLPFVVLCVGFTWTLIVAWLIHQASVIKRTSAILGRQALALNQTSDAMFIQNPVDGIVDCNAAAVQLFGYSKPELLGMHTRDLAADLEALTPLYKQREESFAGEDRWTTTLTCRTKSGGFKTMSIADSEFTDVQGNVIGVVSIARDVTDEEASKLSVAESEAKFRGLFESSRDAISIRSITPDSIAGVTQVNQAYLDMTGYTLSELNALQQGELIPLEEDQQRLRVALKQLDEHGYADAINIKYKRKDGVFRHAETTLWRAVNELGEHIQTISLVRDVTEQEESKIRVAESESKFRGLFETSRDGIAIRPVTEEGVVGTDNVNQAYSDLVGYSLSELEDIPEDQIITRPEDKEKVLRARTQLEKSGFADTISVQYKHKDGSSRLAETTLWRAFNEKNEHTQTIELVRDVTEQEDNRQRLIDSETKFRGLFESSRDAIIIRSMNGPDAGHVIDANQAYLDLVGYSLEDIPVYTANNRIMSPKSYDTIAPHMKQIQELGYTSPFDIEFLHKNGSAVPANVQLWRMFDADGTHVQTITIARDMTDAARAEQGMRQAQGIAQLGSWDQDLVRKSGTWSAELYSIFELESTERPHDYERLLEVLHPEDRDRFARDREHSNREHVPINDIYRIVMDDGRVKHLRFNFRTVLDSDGNALRRLGTAQDITEIRELEDALRHTQKLQTVGQLTAGIAHDFNNILGVISSNAQYLEMIVTDNPDVNVTVDRVVRAVKRGAKLTDQMLSFSRKQALAPTQIEITPFLDELTDTISRALGEEITMDVDVPDAPWSVMADETQLTNALLNLSLNGRDAMAGSGALKIKVQNVDVNESEGVSVQGIEPGSYVAISVQDSGTGMTQEVQDQAFEPFFTTKEIGAGSGLGLSMVYGFADQSGGTVTLDSEVGVGTTITLYLPATDQQGEFTLAKPQKESVVPTAVRTILLVEDQPDLRAINEQVLQKLGHRVITAEDAYSAILAARKVDHIDAAFLDIILPGGMNGIELAARLRETRPSLKILFTTGYAARDVLDKIDHVEHEGLFRKPIQIQDVSARLDEIFGADKSDPTEVVDSTAA